MAISIKCECGKTLSVDEKHRGKKAKCPECGNLVLIEEDQAATAVQAEKPKKKRPVKNDNDGDNEDDRSDPDVRKPKSKKAKKKSMMPMLIGGGCALVAVLSCCVIGIGGGVWYYLNRGPEQDLLFVHQGVAGFVSVRTNDLWNNPRVKDQLKLMPPREKEEMDKKLAEMEAKMGMKVDDLERFTFIIRSTDVARQDFGMVFRTKKPMDAKKIVGAIAQEMNEKEKEVTHEGMKLYVLNGSAVCFPSDRIALVAPNEANLKDILKKSKTPATNAAITRGLEMASSGKYQMVTAFEVKRDLMKEVPDMFMKQAPNVGQLNGVIVAGTLASDLAIEAALTFASKDIALKAKTDVDTFVNLGKVGVKAQKEPGPALLKFMDSITVEQRGSDVVVKAKVDVDLKGFGNVPGLNFGGGGGGGFGGAGRIQSINNLKQIGLAIHSNHDAIKVLPNHAILHPQTGQPLHSWRVALLPYLDQGPLYNQIRRDEPWDSPHNRQFWNKMPAVYQLPGRPNDGRTFYQVFHGDETAFPKSTRPPNLPGSHVTMVGITDGTSNTLFVTETANSVNWMQPTDLPFQMNQQGLINFVGNHWGDNTFLAVMGDGSVSAFRRTIPNNVLQALITRSGGEAVPLDQWRK